MRHPDPRYSAKCAGRKIASDILSDLRKRLRIGGEWKAKAVNDHQQVAESGRNLSLLSAASGVVRSTLMAAEANCRHQP